MKSIASTFFTSIIVSLVAPIFAILNAQSLEGIYETESFLYMKSAFVEFFKHDGKYYAYAIANTDGSSAQKDKHNPNPALRDRSDKGVVFLYDLTQTSPDNYRDGKAYNFYDGRTYYVKISQKPNGDLEFYSSLYKDGIIGKSFLWKRIDKDTLDKYLEAKKLKEPNFHQVLESISQINPPPRKKIKLN
ncbi:DUF2147 domain-containing protein [Helicobacter sp. 11S02596-1]|uniref:DUF2147 domain-containing protein n=1 Tax=Helicobacter sp. 11S02596-1 TaxID=1476194 RepID=UPI000BA56B5E|nr:DUF2147 domain-containing protein [Helicobacter sp. 11S02596-1]PAF43959.1 hypothetical protein BJI48_04005 [Helicobacter sp. 11S02596-1]